MDSSPATNQKTYIHIAQIFLAHLNEQFPITKSTESIRLRKASNFADKLNVHVNHLNRAIKLYTGKTTTQNINQCLTKESKRLLKSTDGPINKIAMVLGFKEDSHFSAFFKKHVGHTPTEYRRVRLRK